MLDKIDWTKIGGPLIGAGATVLGSVIGGPAGAAIGKAAGGVIADALGVDATPEAVAEAIEQNPAAAKAAAESPETAAAVAQAHAEIIKTVNETYREELRSESAFIRMARPGWMWAGNIVFLLFGFGYAKALWLGQYEALSSMGAATMFMTPVLAIVGVISYGRTQEKLAGVGGTISAGAVVGEVVGAVVKKVTRK